MADKKVQVTLMGSPIGCTQKIRDTILGLGLKKRHQTRELEDTPAVRGMIRKVAHMVEVQEAA